MSLQGGCHKRICTRSVHCARIFWRPEYLCRASTYSWTASQQEKGMTKGMSPLRLFMRSSPRSTGQENGEGSTSALDTSFSSSTTSARQPLCPIPEIVRNPLSFSGHHLNSNPSPPTVKGVRQVAFPHLENTEGIAISNGTPEQSSTPIPPVTSKSKFSWHRRQTSPSALDSCNPSGNSSASCSPSQPSTRVLRENNGADGATEFSTPPPRPPKHLAGQEVTQTIAQHLSAAKAAPSNGGSVQNTPRTTRASAARPGTEPETPVGSLPASVTPSRSVSRSLKYGQPVPSTSGNNGLTSIRSTGTQNVITRPLISLQASKGVVPVSVGHSFVEQHFDLEEDSSFWKDHNVQVLIRTRPISSTELTTQGGNRCIKQMSAHTLSWLGQPESRYTFDHVAGEYITQEKLFTVAGLPMVDNCLSGYNSCMFAYGQTGSGKTHTMLGDIDNLEKRPSDNRGMTPRVFEYLFARIQLEQETRRHEHLKYFCKCSFLEIYNEQITDLLEPSSTNLQMREDAKKGVYVENLSEVEVKGVRDVIQLLLLGASNRKVAATNMNRESSRSHSVFTCVVESKWESNSLTNTRYGRLHLVDLAGSERQKSSGAEGGRLKEAANINKSLSTLGLVIMILVDVANGKQKHVPYRDSKLTFLLQDSLGGNSKTIMIANVSPSSCCASETLSTLKFAQRAKFIRNNAVINEDASGDVIALRQKINELKEEVDRLRRNNDPRNQLCLQDGTVVEEISHEMIVAGPGQSKSDTWDGKPLPPSSPHASKKKMKAVEAVLAGALRREQVAEYATKQLAAQIEQLNRLVRQREEDAQCGKMMLRFREDKIRRLEAIIDGILTPAQFFLEEKTALLDELQLIRARNDRNPEVTRFAMENIRLMEQLRRFQEFYDCGERDVMAEEIANLRDQLLEVMENKEDGIEHQTTPQKLAVASELASATRENKLLLIEVDNYQKALKECRDNLNSTSESNSYLTRQVDELQVLVNELKERCSSQKQEELEISKVTQEREQNSSNSLEDPKEETILQLKLQLKQANERAELGSWMHQQLESQLNVALQEAESLRSQLQESKQFMDSLVCTETIADRMINNVSHPIAAQEMATSVQESVKQIPLETEEIAVQQRQSLVDIQDSDILWRTTESELRAQLEEAQTMIEKLSAGNGCQIGESQHARKKLQERELRHSEAILQLQLELESVETVLEEERRLRQDSEPSELLTQQLKELEEKNQMLSEQLNAALLGSNEYLALIESHQDLELKHELQSKEHSQAVSQLQEERAIIQALEGQQLFSIYELENQQEQLTSTSKKLKQSEGKVKVLQQRLKHFELQMQKEQEVHELQREIDSKVDAQKRGLSDEIGMSILLEKLERAKAEKDDARLLNQKLQQEYASRKVIEDDMEMTRAEVESETALAITSLHQELQAMKEESLAAKIYHDTLKEESINLRHELGELISRNEDLELEIGKWATKYEQMRTNKDSEIQELQKDWENATAKLIDYLAEGDEALFEAAKEMEDIIEESIPCKPGSLRRIESPGENMGENCNEQQKPLEQKSLDLLHQRLRIAQELARETEVKVRALSVAASSLENECNSAENSHTEWEVCEARLRDSEKKSNAAFIVVKRLVERAEELEDVERNLKKEVEKVTCKVAEQDALITALQTQVDEEELLLAYAEERHSSLIEAYETMHSPRNESSQEQDVGSETASLKVQLRSQDAIITDLRRKLEDVKLTEGVMDSLLATEGVVHNLLVEEISARQNWIEDQNLFVEGLQEFLVGLEEHVEQLETQINSIQVAERKLNVTRSRVETMAVNEVSSRLELERMTAELCALKNSSDKRDMEVAAASLQNGNGQCLLNEEAEQNANSRKSEAERASMMADLRDAASRLDKTEEVLEYFELHEPQVPGENEQLGTEDVKLRIAALAEGSSSENDQALIPIQIELERVQQKVSEFESLERTISSKMNEILEQWQVEREMMGKQIGDLQMTNDQLVNAEQWQLLAKEKALADGLKRIQEKFDYAEFRVNELLISAEDFTCGESNLRSAVEALQSEILLGSSVVAEKDKFICELQSQLSESEEKLYQLQEFCDSVRVEMSNDERSSSDAEKIWKIEKEKLLSDLHEAKLEANAKLLEAASMNKKFEDGQETLKEAELLVNALVQANESAKCHAQGWKSEKEEWMPLRNSLVMEVGKAKSDLVKRETDMTFVCLDTTSTLLDTIHYLEETHADFDISMRTLDEEIQGMRIDLRCLMSHDLRNVLAAPAQIRSEFDQLFSDYKRNRTNEIENLKAESMDLKMRLRSSEECNSKMAAVLSKVSCNAEFVSHESQELIRLEFQTLQEQMGEVDGGTFYSIDKIVQEAKEETCAAIHEISNLRTQFEDFRRSMDELKVKFAEKQCLMGILEKRLIFTQECNVKALEDQVLALKDMERERDRIKNDVLVLNEQLDRERSQSLLVHNNPAGFQQQINSSEHAAYGSDKAESASSSQARFLILEDELDNVSLENNYLREQIKTIEMQLVTVQEELKHMSLEACELMEETMTASRGDVLDAIHETCNFRSHMDEFQQLFSGLKTRCEKQQCEIAMLKEFRCEQESSPESSEDMMSALMNVELDKDRLRSSILALEQRIAELEAQLQYPRQGSEAHDNQVSALKNVEHERDRLQSEIGILGEQLRNQEKKSVESLELELRTTDAERERDRLLEDVAALKENIEFEQKSSANSLQEISSALEVAKSQEKSLQIKVVGLETQLLLEQQNNDKLLQEQQSNQKLLEEHKASSKRLEIDRERLQNDIHALAAQLEEERTNMVALEEKLQFEQQSCTEPLQDLIKSLKEADSTREQLQRNLQALTAELEENRTRAVVLETQVQLQQLQQQVKDKSLDDQINAFRNMESERDRLRNEILELAVEIEEERSDVVKLEKQLLLAQQSSSISLEDHIRDLKAVESQKDALQSDILALNLELQLERSNSEEARQIYSTEHAGDLCGTVETYSSLEGKVRTVEQKLGHAVVENKYLKEQLTTMKVEIVDVHLELHQQLSDIECQAHGLMKELTRIVEEQMQGTMDETNELRTLLAGFQETICQCQVKLHEKQYLVETLKNRLQVERQTGTRILEDSLSALKDVESDRDMLLMARLAEEEETTEFEEDNQYSSLNRQFKTLPTVEEDPLAEELANVVWENKDLKEQVITMKQQIASLQEELNTKQTTEDLEERLLTGDPKISQLLRVLNTEYDMNLEDILLQSPKVMDMHSSALADAAEEYKEVQFQLKGKPFGLDSELLNLKSEMLKEMELIEEKKEAAELQAEAAMKEKNALTDEFLQMQSKITALEEELQEKRHAIDLLEEELMIEEQKSAHAFENISNELKITERERDRLQTDLLVLNEQLEMAQTLADERELVASEARQIAELRKTHAEEKNQESKLLARSVEELESTVYALESQLGIVKRETERQRLIREDLEIELRSVKHQMSSMQSAVDKHEAQYLLEIRELQTSKTEKERAISEMDEELQRLRKEAEHLQRECKEKDVQIFGLKTHISELLLAADNQAAENQQKLKALESMLEHLKLEERKANLVATSVQRIPEKSMGAKAKGSGSPFKCIGSNLQQQMTSEIDEELSSYRRRIEELEALAACRQKEVFMLNTKLAEAESMTHDVVRDLLGIKLDITNYATILNQHQVHQIAEKARQRSEESQEKEEELHNLRKQLHEFIAERESWLEEIHRRQGEMVAARVAAEKIRIKEQTLSVDNAKLQAENASQKKRLIGFEEEIKKLSGQQNLQQRIHHHAKIKEENNLLRSQNEELNGRLRRTEILFTRVNDELARYRSADGKAPFLNFDEEQRLQRKLQEVEENRMQLAQTLISLCTSIMKTAGISKDSIPKDIDTATALEALKQMQECQQGMERELSDLKLQSRIVGEKRRLSELRTAHSPMKTISLNYISSQQSQSLSPPSR